MALTNAAAGFIGASVTLVLVIIFMILMVILVRQCLAFISKRNAIRAQMEHQRQIREQIRQRRGSVTEPIPATFDWHHSIRIAGTPPPSYGEAKQLPSFKDAPDGKEGDMATQQSPPLKEAESGGGGNEMKIRSESSVQSNGVHHQAGVEVVVQVEQGGSNAEQRPQDRNFTTEYTEYSSA